MVYRGELRATGQVLRDQFVFMLRAGFDAFEVKKESDAEAFAATAKRYSVFYQPTGDGRITALASAHADAPFGECQPVNGLTMRCCRSGCRPAPDLPAAEALDRALRDAAPAEVIAAALQAVGRERLALVSSFGTESAALLKVMAEVDPAIPVIFLDTGWLFEETLAYRDMLIARSACATSARSSRCEETLSREDPDRELWFSDPDACCRIRKVEPLARALAPFNAWINGRKRFQGGLRAGDPGGRGRRRQAEIQSVRQRLARADRGDLCAMPNCRRIRCRRAATCRSAACPAPAGRSADEDARAGRWRGRPKTECGIHTVKTS